MGVGMTPTDDLVPHYWLKPQTTDADGRFTFDGLPRGTYVHLDFWHPDYAVDEVTVDTTVAGGIAKVVKTVLNAFEIPPVKPNFTHTLEPARPVQGRVTDKQTGKPLAGLLVRLNATRRHGGTPFFSRTDADGRYRISGHQAENYRTTVFPTADSGYLGSKHLPQTWPAGAKVLEQDFALDKGRIVRGRVIDAGTKRPIAGAAVRYQPRGSNPNNRREYDLSNTILTDADGRFAITALPGQGVVAVQTPDETYMLEQDWQGQRAYKVVAVETPDKTYMRVPGGPLISAQGVASIDVPDDGDAKPVEIAVRNGAFLKAKVIGPDGKTVPEVAASCDGIAPMVMISAWEPSAKGVFRLAGADPAKTYRVFFIQPDRQLGAVVDLKPDSDSRQPIEVTLHPTAKVHGKVVNENGSPAENVQVQPMIVMGKPEEGEMTRSEILRDTEIYVNMMGQKGMMAYWMKVLQPRPKGEFVVDTLVPGACFYITAGAGRREAYVFVPPLKPGEDRDLGTITLKEQKP
jgi:5-hydroxyisourate hydrolase-like protein (transthyretin family)